MTVKTVTILLVDDDIVDVMAVKRSFLTLKISNPVIEAQDGVEALERLRGENGFDKIPNPCLILLDLNMPRMTGIEFLQALRSDPVLRRNVVFIMTTSAAEEDLLRSYELNVAGYVLKHQAGKSFIDALAMLEHYWRVVEFPT
jgi:CheY-like chemotaxis protein